jgi:prophage regulatory protein
MENLMVKKALRRKDVLAATGWSKTTLYNKIAEGSFPKGTKIDPNGRAVVWWDDVVAKYQQAAIASSQEVASA